MNLFLQDYVHALSDIIKAILEFDQSDQTLMECCDIVDNLSHDLSRQSNVTWCTNQAVLCG